MNKQHLSPEYSRFDRIPSHPGTIAYRLLRSGITVLSLSLLTLAGVSGQTLLWEESFDEPNGVTTGMASGPEATPWSVTGHTTGSQLQVNGVADRLQGSNLDEFETWQTGPINIAG